MPNNDFTIYFKSPKQYYNLYLQIKPLLYWLHKNSYIKTVRENTLLDSLKKENEYMIRPTDEERLQEREEGRKQGIWNKEKE